MARRLAAIMFTDLEGYTSLAHHDEASALRLLGKQEELIAPLIVTHGGRKIKSTGDGLLVEFPSAREAVECAVALQRSSHELNARNPTLPLRIRVGLHVGDVEDRGLDILGDAVNIASRVQLVSDAEGICLTSQVYYQVINKVDCSFENLGPRALKGIADSTELYRVVFPWSPPVSNPDQESPPRIAVLPLRNISPDPNDEYLADGLTEELTSTFSRMRAIGVVSRTSTLAFKNRTKSVVEVGRELNVTTILEGSVRKSGERVRIAVQLIDAVRDRHLWSETYDRSVDDLFAIQSEIAQKVAGALEVRLLRQDRNRLERTPTEVTEAHLLYMKGSFLAGHGGKEDYLAAIWYFEEAVRRDPRYALAFAAMANAYNQLGYEEMVPWTEASTKGEEAARKALELDPSLAEAHVARVMFLVGSWDFAAALDAAQRALQLNPDLSSPHDYAAWVYLILGRLKEARWEARKSIELDPLSAGSVYNAGMIHMCCRDFVEAEAFLEQAVRMDPLQVFARDYLGLSRLAQGRLEEGIADVQEAFEMSKGDSPGVLSDLIYALTRASRSEEARTLLSQLLEYHRKHGTDAYAIASAYASLGDRDKAFEWLEKGFQAHDPVLVEALYAFNFEKLRSDPRFLPFREKILRQPVDTVSGVGR